MLGNGTQSNPFIIQTVDDFERLRVNRTAYYELGNDLDFNNADMLPLSTSAVGERGEWKFDGKGYTLKNINLQQGVNNSSIGLFGYLYTDSEVVNVNLENINLYVQGVTIVSGGLFAGTIIGKVDNVKIKGSITVNDCTIGRIGGLCGQLIASQNRGKVSNLFTDIDMVFINSTNSSAPNLGGVFAQLNTDANNTNDFIHDIVSVNSYENRNSFNYIVGTIYGATTNNSYTFKNVYGNTSKFPNQFQNNVSFVNDTTILNPLTLDTNYWTQSPNSVPQLKAFTPKDYKEVSVEVDVAFKPVIVAYNGFKNKTGVFNPVEFRNVSTLSEKAYNTIRDIEVIPFNLDVTVSKVNNVNAEGTVILGDILIDKQTEKDVLRLIGLDLKRFNVSVEVLYPQIENAVMHAYVYSQEHCTNLTTKTCTTSITTLQNRTTLGVE